MLVTAVFLFFFLVIFFEGVFFLVGGLDFLDEVVDVDQDEETGRGFPKPWTVSIMNEMVKISLFYRF